MAFAICAFTSAAAAQESPPFTVAFEETLKTYGDCLHGIVDRYPVSTEPNLAARGAIVACNDARRAAESQLAADYISRLGYSTKHAASAAKSAMQNLQGQIEKSTTNYAMSKRTNASN
jgi:hypothetical protein